MIVVLSKYADDDHACWCSASTFLCFVSAVTLYKSFVCRVFCSFFHSCRSAVVIASLFEVVSALRFQFGLGNFAICDAWSHFFESFRVISIACDIV